jgi:preprotein translocase subunit SecD
VVQLPGVQDTAKAKDILGRTATLELRMVDESSEGRAAEVTAAAPCPFGSERHLDRNGQAVITKRQVVLTGENLTDAQAGFDSQTQEAAVHLTWMPRVRAFSATSPATTSASAWPSCCLKKARAKW